MELLPPERSCGYWWRRQWCKVCSRATSLRRSMWTFPWSSPSTSVGTPLPSGGGLSGMFFGWMQDAILGIFLGLNGMSKALIGFGGSYLSKLLVLEGFVARCVMIGTLCLLNNLFLLGLGSLLGQTIPRGVWLRTLIQVPATGLFGGIVFLLYDRMKFSEKDFRKF